MMVGFRCTIRTPLFARFLLEGSQLILNPDMTALSPIYRDVLVSSHGTAVSLCNKMPPARRKRTPSLAQQMRSDLRTKQKNLTKQLTRVKRDLRSFGVRRKRKHA